MAKQPWFMRSPALYQSVQAQLQAEFRTLRLSTEDQVAIVRGALPITGDDGTELDRFQIEIQLPYDFPNAVPTVKETAGKITRIPDRHVNDDGTACLFVRDQTREYWNAGTTIVDFIKGPVYQFFLGQIYFAEHGRWPFGQRAHGAEGIAQFYFDELGTTSLWTVAAFLSYLAAPSLDMKQLCYCGGNKKLKHCHLGRLLSLRAKIPRDVAIDSLKQIRLLARTATTKRKPLAPKLAKSLPLMPYSQNEIWNLCCRLKYTNRGQSL